MVNEKVAKMQDKRIGTEVAKKFDEEFKKKPLPKFPCKVRVSQYGALEVRVYIPDKYIRKVLKV